MVIVIVQGKAILFDYDSLPLIKNKKLTLHRSIIRNKMWGVAYYDKTLQRCLPVHRLIMNATKGNVVDHINHNVFDNRKENLRICTVAKNNENRLKQNGTECKYKGIYINKSCKTKKYIAQIMFNNKRIKIGSFNRPEQAALAYDVFALKYFGKYACLNFPHLSHTN